MNNAVKVLLMLVVVLSPFAIGALITIASMIHAFHDLGDKGVSDPNLLSAHIGNALVATWAGIMVSVVLFFVWIGYLLVQFANKRNKLRES